MATLTLTVAASDDDWITNEALNNTDGSGGAFAVGGIGFTPPAGYGIGFRFTGASALVGATINSAYAYLLKSGAQWNVQDDRWAFEDADSPAVFDGTSNQPGDRTLVTTNIADESTDVNRTDATRYGFPTTSPLRTTLGSNLQSVVNRAGFASVLALIDNGDGDASAYNDTSRMNYHSYDSATGSSEPQLVVDYTAAAGGAKRLLSLGVG